MRHQQKIEKEDKEDCLAEDPECLDNSVFFRAFFFQLLTSRGKFLRVLFDGLFGGKAALEALYQKKWRLLHQQPHNQHLQQEFYKVLHRTAGLLEDRSELEFGSRLKQ